MSENKVRYFQGRKTGSVLRAATEADALDFNLNPALTEVQVVPVDAIVIRREDVPKVHVVGGLVTAGEDENGDAYSCSVAANPNWPYWYGINALAVSEFLREREESREPEVKESVLGRSIVAALAEAAEMVDEIEGSQLNVNGARVWVHTQEQVAEWLHRLLDDDEGAAAEFKSRIVERGL